MSDEPAQSGGDQEETSTSRESQLTATFVEIADSLVLGYDIADVLHTLAVRCVEIFGVSDAGIMLNDEDGALHAVASSSENVQSMHLLQLQTESGPCWEAARTGAAVHVPDLEAEAERWPEYVARGLELGLRSVHALPLRLRDRTIGALNVFRDTKGSLDQEDLKAIQALADVATISLLQARAVEEAEESVGHLQIALDSRVLIEQAKGIVSNNLDLEMSRSFQLLRTHARSHNLKLTEVCKQVIDGALSPSELASARRSP